MHLFVCLLLRVRVFVYSIWLFNMSYFFYFSLELSLLTKISGKYHLHTKGIGIFFSIILMKNSCKELIYSCCSLLFCLWSECSITVLWLWWKCCSLLFCLRSECSITVLCLWSKFCSRLFCLWSECSITLLWIWSKFCSKLFCLWSECSSSELESKCYSWLFCLRSPHSVSTLCLGLKYGP